MTALVMFLVVAFGSSALSAPPAVAGAAEAMDRCRAGQQGDVVFDYRFEFYNVPTVTIGAGDLYRVQWTDGEMKIGHWPWDPSYNPNGTGWADTAPVDDYPSWPMPGGPKYGLIAGWDGLPGYFWLGANSLCIQWTGATPARVVLDQNDSMQSDNSGNWDFEFHIYRA
ncbi:hypothetical protein [Nocardia sp. NPDC003979]